MSKPAFWVEGALECDFLKAACPGSAVVSAICNGETVSVEAIVERIQTHYILLVRRGFAPIIVILDNERRTTAWHKLKADILSMHWTARHIKSLFLV